jgi:serine/threonine protein kinase
VSSRRGEEPVVGKYKLLKTIGKGNFAKVKLAKHVPTGKEVSSVQFHSKEAFFLFVFCSFFI